MIQNLTRREKLFLAAGAVALLLLIIIFGIISPYRSALANLDSKVGQRQQQLQQVKQLQLEFQRLQVELAQRERKLARSGGASAFSSIENIVTRLGFRDKLVAMRPQPASEREGLRVETVATRLEGISLEQLVGLLKSFAASNTLLNVSSMQIRTRFADPSLLDVELQVETLKRSS